MQDFADIAEAHAWTMRRLREMAGRLTERAYLRASAAAGQENEEASARWMLIFDRMARGLRLSIALEAKLARERRWDADEIAREASGVRHEPRWRKGAAAPATAGSGEAATCEAEPREFDAERDDDGLPQDALLGQRIGRLQSIIEGAGTPQAAPVPGRAERRARKPKHAKRFRWADTPSPPNGPIPAAADRAADESPPWRGSG